MTPSELLQAWHDAVNAKDVDAALALCAPDVAVGGPRGTGSGHEVMRAWLQRSGIELHPQHDLVVSGGRAVVHEKARWTTTDDAPVQLRDGSEHDTWVVFDVAGDRLTAVRRHETEDDALREVGTAG
jgi:ketosteroid isomerase-like protein